ncbi:hypothetical protein [Bacillus sp. AK031]
MKKKTKSLSGPINALLVIMAVIFMRLVDEYLYDFSIWVGGFLCVLLYFVSSKIISKFSFSRKIIGNKTAAALDISVYY